MDLDRCPRCGNAWAGGEKCRSCGFVPIGAGLGKLPKKKKKRHRKYVEPGSSRGLFWLMLLGVSGWGLYRYQPWTNDWESVRALFGQGRRHSIVGDWEIEKILAFSTNKPVIHADEGLVKFEPGGKVAFELHRGDAESTATGRYAVVGTAVTIHGLSGDAEGLAKGLNLDLAWTGSDSLVASCNGAEALYLRRRSRSGSLERLLHMGLKSGTPGEMRGAIATETHEIEDQGASNQ